MLPVSSATLDPDASRMLSTNGCNLWGEDVRAQLYGGSMIIKWQPGYSVMMTGPTAFVYEGVFSPDGLMAQAGIKPTPEG